jgi:hypothetical protein
MPQAASIVALVAAIAFTAPAYANEDDSVFSEATISDSELSDQRGGFQFAGMEIKLGADIRTFLDNTLVLHTVITIDEHGYNRVQTIADNLTLADADALKNTILSNGAIRMNVGNNQVYLANEGKTAIIHGNEDALQNILINTASNITASQDVTATLDLAGYDGFAATVTADQLGRSLGDDVARAITGTFGG